MAKEVKATNGAKADLEDELTKVKAENAKLQNQVQGSQEDLQTVQRNYAIMSGKAMGLEKEIKAVETRLREVSEIEANSREAVVQEAKQQAIDEFKESEKYLASQNYDARYKNGYDKGVE